MEASIIIPFSFFLEHFLLVKLFEISSHWRLGVLCTRKEPTSYIIAMKIPNLDLKVLIFKVLAETIMYILYWRVTHNEMACGSRCPSLQDRSIIQF